MFAAAEPYAVKHGFGHLRRIEQAGYIDHEFCIGDEPSDVFPRVARPVFQIVQKPSGIETDPIPFLEPSGDAITFKRMLRWILFNFFP